MLGDKIKEIRESQNKGLNDTAKLANISASYLSDLEKNKKLNPSMDTLKKIARALNVNVNVLLSTEERLDIAMETISKVNEMAKKALSKSDIDFSNTLYPICTNFDGEKFTKNEQKEIINFIKYVISKRKEND